MAFIYFVLAAFFTRDLTIMVYVFVNTIVSIIIALSITGLSLAKRKEVQANKKAHMELKRVIDAATKVSMIATDTSGTITMFSSGAQHMLGYLPEEVIGKKTPRIIHLESEVAARSKELTEEMGYPVEGFEAFVTYARQGKFDEREWTYIRKDGKRITVNLIVTAVKDEAGVITGFLGIATDVSEREKTYKAIREVESRFSAIVDNAPDGIIFCETDTQKITFSNPAMTQIFGYSEKELLSMKVQDLCCDKDWNLILSHLDRHISGETSKSHNIPMLKKDGDIVFVEVSSSVFNIRGKKYFAGFFTDLTEHNRAERERLLLESVIKKSNETAIDNTPEGIILNWNIIAEKIYGYTAKEIIGKSISNLISPEREGDIPQMLERVNSGGVVKNFKTERLRKDGKRALVSLSITPVKDMAGRVISISTIIREITERDRTEKR
jgi:PAS domain S-box-containing protein